ncbi:MAG TPA: thioredoxin [Oligoflexus sp.]|uniref:thioredoxin n=1 Tax=Oligoflexus sp. TaxID=1971216 RepID=UPI002D3CA145|nr:thioredoxin [Oligoflexus sp.]HYX34955.1 thioredoxin [Oligoflexus sp.]
MDKPNVVDVNLRNFAADVVRRSQDVPVLVDFWAEWCGPCKSLTPVLEKLAADYGGRFILAKCNTDENQDLARQFGIRGIPACKLFKDGALVAEFQGAQPEGEVRRFLDEHCADPEEQPLEVARQLLGGGQVDDAMAILEGILTEDPAADDARRLLVRALIHQHDFEKARETLAVLPATHSEVKSLQQMIDYASTASDYGTVEDCEARAAQNPQDLEALYRLGVVLTLEDRFQDAMDRFLQIIAKNKNYGEGKVRQAMLALFEVLGPDHELTHQYRRKFANLIL